MPPPCRHRGGRAAVACVVLVAVLTGFLSCAAAAPVVVHSSFKQLLLDKMIMSPRCCGGVEDHHADGVSPLGPGPGHGDHHAAVVSRFALVGEGKPPWSKRPSPIVVTYAFSPNSTIKYPPAAAVRAVFHRAFARWAQVIPIPFLETDDYADADVKVGFYAFDSPLGLLARTSTLDGNLHLDASERWVVDGDDSGAGAGAVDLETVATHEIGHILGLDHSTLPDAVMYPIIRTLEKKVNLTLDDVQGVQLLYGANPDFNISSLYDPPPPPAQNSMPLPPPPAQNSMSPPPERTRSSCMAVMVGIVLVILATSTRF